MICLDGRVVLVTGGGRGLGAAYARAFAARGASAVVHDGGVGRGGEGADKAVADAVVAEIRSSGGTAIAAYENLEAEDACLRGVETAIAEPGRLDVLVNNAGIVLSAAGGRFAVRGWARSKGIDFGRDPVRPEQIAERWAEIESLH